MKGKNNPRKTRKVKETITRMTSGLRPLKHDARHYHDEIFFGDVN